MSPHQGNKHSYAKLPSKEVELSSLEEGKQQKHGSSSSSASSTGAKENKLLSGPLTTWGIIRVLSPYFWPAEGSDGAWINRIRSTSTWLMVALSKVCNLIGPIYLSKSTDALLAHHYPLAAQYMIIFALLRFLSSFFKEMQSIIYIKVKQQASIELQETTFAHILSLSLQWHLSKKTGSVVKSMDRGVEAANQIITYLFLFLLPAVLECVAVMILFLIRFGQWQLSLLVFGGVSLYATLTIVITQWRKKFREQSNKHDNDFHDKATDSIMNYETVKYFTAEEYEKQRFKQSVVQYQKYNSTTQFSLSLLNVSQQLVLGLTVLGAMLISGKEVVKGNMSIGTWFAIQAWVGTIFVPLNFLGSVYSAILQAFIDIQNLSELLACTSDIKEDPHASDLILRSNSSNTGGASIEFRDISFQYPGQDGSNRGLHHVSFVGKSGSKVAFIGPTGAGKTTISRLIFRFFDPQEGSVYINGCDIRDYTLKSVRQLIGIVPQDTILFNDTILYNIQYGNKQASFADVERVAEIAQIKKFIESLPEGWNTVVGERGLKLSGGEKQRIAIARCLLKDPPIVILDEATSALDTITESSIQEALNALGKHRTVIIIAHRLSTIKHADQIVVLEEGRIVEKGSHDELNANPNSSYRKMLQAQLEMQA